VIKMAHQKNSVCICKYSRVGTIVHAMHGVVFKVLYSSLSAYGT